MILLPGKKKICLKWLSGSLCWILLYWWSWKCMQPGRRHTDLWRFFFINVNWILKEFFRVFLEDELLPFCYVMEEITFFCYFLVQTALLEGFDITIYFIFLFLFKEESCNNPKSSWHNLITHISKNCIDKVSEMFQEPSRNFSKTEKSGKQNYAIKMCLLKKWFYHYTIFPPFKRNFIFR